MPYAPEALAPQVVAVHMHCCFCGQTMRSPWGPEGWAALSASWQATHYAPHIYLVEVAWQGKIEMVEVTDERHRPD